jgi:hypothetical protein
VERKIHLPFNFIMPYNKMNNSKKHTITLQKINDVKVKPIKIKNPLNKPAKGEDMFPNPFGNIIIVARKNSGKSNLIANIIKNCAEPGETSVICMSTTVNKDPIWHSMKIWCKQRNIPFEGVTELNSLDGNHKKTNFLTEFMKTVLKGGEEHDPDDEDSDDEQYGDGRSEDESGSEDSRAEIEDDEDEQYDIRDFGMQTVKPRSGIKFPKDKTSLKKEKPYVFPEYITIFDDIGEEISSRPVQAFVKKNRHLHAMNILSVQSIKDLLPAMHRQGDFYILFSGLQEDALEKVKKDADLGIPLEVLWEIYKKCTAVKYSFLYIDVRNEQYRCNFNSKFNITV